jgi:hypothetical protein
MNVTYEDGSKDNIYVNVVINGSSPNYNPTEPGIPSINTPPTGEGGSLAEYKVTKTAPFLDNPSAYYCSVVRFVVPLQLIPLFIMPIIPNTYVNPGSPGNSDLSTLIFGMIYLGNRTSQRVIYNADNILNAPIQNQPTQVVTPYYYVYTYSHMIQMINLQLGSIWISSGLKAAFPTLNPPSFIYDPVTQLISLIVPFIFVTGVATLYMNAASLQFLEGFHLSFQGYNRPNGEDFVFIPEDNPNFYYPNPGIPSTPQYYKYTQDYNTLYYWTSLRKLIFSSQNIPITNEVVPANNDTGTYSSFPIITDFVIGTEQAGQSRSLAVYNPQGQYRLISLSGNSPISAIDIKIFWQDQQGNLYPLFIPQNQQASIKIGFFKKSLYNSTSNTRKV